MWLTGTSTPAASTLTAPLVVCSTADERAGGEGASRGTRPKQPQQPQQGIGGGSARAARLSRRLVDHAGHRGDRSGTPSTSLLLSPRSKLQPCRRFKNESCLRLGDALEAATSLSLHTPLQESSVPPWGIDAFTALVGVDVEMDPPAAPSPPRGKKVRRPPRHLSFSSTLSSPVRRYACPRAIELCLLSSLFLSLKNSLSLSLSLTLSLTPGGHAAVARLQQTQELRVAPHHRTIQRAWQHGPAAVALYTDHVEVPRRCGRGGSQRRWVSSHTLVRDSFAWRGLCRIPDVYGTGGARIRRQSRKIDNMGLPMLFSRGAWIPGGALETASIRHWLGGVRYQKHLPTALLKLQQR
jgi:hypothetical protein